MGGKLSEGINFKDHLARVVICISLPFPNVKSPEIVERMSYYDGVNASGPGQQGDGFSGCEFYQNLCMRVVNQSIGRAIRHKDDFAMILLIDERYSRDSIKKSLPSWILNRCENFESFNVEELAKEIGQFFQDKY